MPEEKRKINAWIPVSLFNQIESAGYENTTQAIIKALEMLLLDPQEDTEGYNEDIEGYLQDIAGYKQDIAALTTENDKLKEDLSGYHRIQEGYKKDLERQNQDIIGYKQDIIRLNEELDKRPDLVTFAQLQARYEGLQEIIREKEKSIERLENDLNKAGQREEDLKQMHNNYMLQVQSLINQRALSAPSGSRNTKEATKKKQEETGSNQEESRPAQKEEKGHIEKICKHCGNPFYTDNIQKEYCCKEHKDTAYNEKRRKERQVNREKEASGLT